MNSDDLAVELEALLFALGPMHHKALAEALGVEEPQCEQAIATLVRASSGRGVVVVDDGRVVELRAAPQAAMRIERVRREEFAREIGRAGQETLAAVLYRGPLTRSEIDFIRGVNSTQILRTLTMRGLLRKTPNPKDERSFLYEPTTELLAQLGVTTQKELPEYAAVRAKLSKLEETYRSQQENATP